MPSNCCVPNCVANAASYINLRFYRFPSDPKRRSVWKRLVRNEDFSVHPYICCLHFEGSVKTYDVDTPTIFHWTREWSGVLLEYNQSHCSWQSKGHCIRLFKKGIPSATKKPCMGVRMACNFISGGYYVNKKRCFAYIIVNQIRLPMTLQWLPWLHYDYSRKPAGTWSSSMSPFRILHTSKDTRLWGSNGELWNDIIFYMHCLHYVIYVHICIILTFKHAFRTTQPNFTCVQVPVSNVDLRQICPHLLLMTNALLVKGHANRWMHYLALHVCILYHMLPSATMNQGQGNERN